jgi:hypothetical protein
MASLCRTCRGAVIWAATVNTFKRIALNVEPVFGGNIDLRNGVAYVVAPVADVKRYVSHFATCPQAAQHRRLRSRLR